MTPLAPRSRTAPEIKKIFEKHGGNLGTTGCVAYIFQTRGQVFVSEQATDEETLMNTVLDIGADDVVDTGDAWQVLCEPAHFIPVREAVEAANIAIESAGLTMIPTATATCCGNDARKLIDLIEALRRPRRRTETPRQL